MCPKYEGVLITDCGYHCKWTTFGASLIRSGYLLKCVCMFLQGEASDRHEQMTLCQHETTHLLANPIWWALHLKQGDIIHQSYDTFFLIGIVGGGAQLGPLSTTATNRPTVPAPDDYDDGEIGGMITGKGKSKYLEKSCPIHALSNINTTYLPGPEPGPLWWQASDLTAWATAQPILWYLTRDEHPVFMPRTHSIWTINNTVHGGIQNFSEFRHNFYWKWSAKKKKN
jgi:hypothetical protein